MKDKDYSYSNPMNSHYSCPSMFGKMVKKQYEMQPKYGDGASRIEKSMDHGPKGAQSNTQKGP